jgi:D-alanyl-D-alanine carboxypeptidase/D-alanyl-D-alanine-endopeptidase (penicillin-binding protein 4)
MKEAGIVIAYFEQMKIMHRLLFFVFSLCFLTGRAQQVASSLQQAVKKLEADPQMKYALLGFYVVESSTGKKVFDRNGSVGLPVASSQKVITSVTAFELLGRSYQYKTSFGYSGQIREGILYGNLVITGTGDPTFGSWRWMGTKDSAVFGNWIQSLKKAGISAVQGNVVIGPGSFSKQVIPDGWTWQDIGNYYGAGSGILNWHENQYDLFLQSGNRVGDKVNILPWNSNVKAGPFENELKTAARGTGDNAYIYLPVGSSAGLLKGTIPAGEKRFSISGALPDPQQQLISDFNKTLSARGIAFNQPQADAGPASLAGHEKITELAVHESPALDSINFWFLRRSINLYGEALVKSIALKENGYASTQDGVSGIKKFWAARGIDSAALNIQDGSGLSPLNRVTPAALVAVMRFAKSKPWFPSFYQALPEYNGLRMKSGTIGGVKSFTGYIKSRSGVEYCFAVVVSNYNGPSSSIVRKLYNVLNVLK